MRVSNNNINQTGAVVAAYTDKAGTPHEWIPVALVDTGPGRCELQFPDAPYPQGVIGLNIEVAKEGFKTFTGRIDLPPYGQTREGTSINLEPSVAPFPPVPSREEVLGIKTSFMGGIIIDSPVYGRMPWWDSALAWCDYATRQLVYAAKKADQAQIGCPETHCLLEVPSGAPLYNEYGQFYSPDKFGPLDWTNGLTSLSPAFDALATEIIRAGFKVHIAMDESFPVSIQVIKLVAQRLKDLGITKYCVVMPGYDGVFYGWTPEQVQEWFDTARSINPDIILVMEFDPGHLPLGNGPADFQVGGMLQNCDGLLPEFNWPPDNTIWGIFERIIPNYVQPPDQNVDFPPAPFYLVDSARGPRSAVYWETYDPFRWVRIDPNDDSQVAAARAELATIRAYGQTLGCAYTG